MSSVILKRCQTKPKCTVSLEEVDYLAGRRHGVPEVTLEDKIVVVGGRGAEDGDGGLAVALHHLRLDVAQRLREVQVERGLVGVFAGVLDFERKLETLLAAHEVLDQVPGERRREGFGISPCILKIKTL